MVQLWDAREVLDMRPHIKGFEYKARASNILTQISTLDVVQRGVDQEMTAQLRNLAACTLCPRWHSGDESQINSTTLKFRQVVERFVVVSRAQRRELGRRNGQRRQIPIFDVQQQDQRPPALAGQQHNREQPANRVHLRPRQAPVPIERAALPLPQVRVPVPLQQQAPALPEEQPNELAHRVRQDANLAGVFQQLYSFRIEEDWELADDMLHQIIQGHSDRREQNQERERPQVRAERSIARDHPRPPRARADVRLRPRPAANIQAPDLEQQPAIPPAPRPRFVPPPPRSPAPVAIRQPTIPPAPRYIPPLARAPRPYGPGAPAAIIKNTQPQHLPRRQPLDDDCYVCYEAIDHLDDAVWCKAECGKNIHRGCFEQWAREKIIAGQDITCAHW
ncbi:hypothetical protein EG329_010986 [Mollisiaceae sp. DMI_Dod_QoI]|nr:hypothetical protein EG329_010986 [Helotiales sp. DMI_Dod_QoI]